MSEEREKGWMAHRDATQRVAASIYRALSPHRLWPPDRDPSDTHERAAWDKYVNAARAALKELWFDR
jgi:hypothetical protein